MKVPFFSKKITRKNKLLLIFFIFLSISGVIIYFLFFAVTSKQAFINARLVNIYSPISGVVDFSTSIIQGAALTHGEKIGEIKANESNQRLSELISLNSELTQSKLNLISQQNALEEQIKKVREIQKNYHSESAKQRKIQVKYSRNRIKQYQADLERVRSSLIRAKNDLKRSSSLVPSGAISKSQHDSYKEQVISLNAEMNSINAKISQENNVLEANELGLHVEGNRTISNVEEQYRNIELQLIDLTSQHEILGASIKHMTEHIKNISDEILHQKSYLLSSPKEGLVVWSVPSQTNSIISQQDLLISLIDCEDTWVEAFVDESHIGKIEIGKEVELKISGINQKLIGKVHSIRSGLGRVEIGPDVAMPPPEIARRQLPVKVLTVRITIQQKDILSDKKQYCFVGRSVNVRF